MTPHQNHHAFGQNHHAFGQNHLVKTITHLVKTITHLVKTITHLVKTITHLVKSKTSNCPAPRVFKDLFTCTKYYKYYEVIKNSCVYARKNRIDTMNFLFKPKHQGVKRWL
jgi:hypothetical protein